jgi:thiamine pyrophosphate-dependent acetolactate synthase large subunit-like protein
VIRNGGAAVVETLAAHGVDTVFGIPGTHNLELYRWFTPTGIRPVTPRHEQGAGYAADAAAWVSGRPGVVVTTSGPGLLNAAAAAATSWAESRPVLLLSPGAPTGTGSDLGRLHETKDATGALDRIVAWSRRVSSPEEAADAVAAAFAAFATGRPRPVHVEIPLDVLETPWSGPVPTAAAAPAPTVPADALRAAADVLRAARTPLIVAGGGAVDAAGPLRALAEALGAPVATTVNGKAVLDEAHPLSVGASVRLRALQSAAAESDAVLVVGSELGDSDLWEGRITGRTLLRLDVDAAQLRKNAHADLVLHGDAATTLTALRALLPATGATAARARELHATCRKEALVDGAPFVEVTAAVRAGLPADGILTGDSSQVTYLGAVHLFDQATPRSFCYTPGFATLGYGLPAAIGAKLAAPGRPVACLLGDGALMFSVQELATAVDLGLPIPIVVADNGGYAEIRAQQQARGIAPVAVDLATPDFVALARAMGAHGVAADDPAAVAAHVRDGLTADRPTLIHMGRNR